MDAAMSVAEHSLLQQLREELQLELSLDSSGKSGWSFTQGLILGQVSVIVVIIVFIKFFVFSDQQTKTSFVDTTSVVVKHDEDDGESPLESKILDKTYYDVKNHPPETLDWFNVLVAQAISQLRMQALLQDNIFHSLNSFLATASFPDFIDKIKLTEIDIGDDFPICSNCRVVQTNGRLQTKIDVDLSDTLTLGIETKILLNHPRPMTAILPVALTVSIVRFSGCLGISLVKDNPEDSESPTSLVLSFAPDYRLELTVKSLIGSRAKLQDVPKISSVIESQLRNWFSTRYVEPHSFRAKLPNLWPKKEEEVAAAQK
ncbi:maintenance of mitochondrial morphology protein 1 [Diutina catenulata]